MRNERNKVWIDEFQTKLFVRIGLYLFAFLICHANLLFIWNLLRDGAGNPLEQYARTFVDHAPTFLCLTLLLPFLAWDAVRFSHRLVGPLVRFRKTMQSIAAGEPVRPIKLRDGDFLMDVRDDFNKMLEALQRQGVPALKPADPAEEPPQRQSA